LDPVRDQADLANALRRELHGAVEMDGEGTDTVIWLDRDLGLDA
jgi:hypothetical protein